MVLEKNGKKTKNTMLSNQPTKYTFVYVLIDLNMYIKCPFIYIYEKPIQFEN